MSLLLTEISIEEQREVYEMIQAVQGKHVITDADLVRVVARYGADQWNAGCAAALRRATEDLRSHRQFVASMRQLIRDRPSTSRAEIARLEAELAKVERSS